LKGLLREGLRGTNTGFKIAIILKAINDKIRVKNIETAPFQMAKRQARFQE
jgi:hypothetical protein